MGGIGHIFSSIIDAVTGGVTHAFKTITSLLTGHFTEAIQHALISVTKLHFLDPVTKLIFNKELSSFFEDKYKDITNAESRVYNLIGTQEPTNTRQEFVDRAVIFDTSFKESLDHQIFSGGSAKFLRYIRWCKNTDAHKKLGYTVDSSATFDSLGSNNAMNKYEFAPVLCLRAWTVPAFEENYPTYYPFLKEACKRAFSDRKALDKMIEDIHKSESANDIDFAYVFYGTPINRKERASLRYIWVFFYWLLSKDKDIEATTYNYKNNGVDAQWYLDNNKYTEYKDKYYVQFAEINSSKGITFLALPESEGNVLKVPFQWRISWSSIIYQGGNVGHISAKSGIDIVGSRTGATIANNRVKGRLGFVVGRWSEDLGHKEHKYYYCVYPVIYRTNRYKGSYFAEVKWEYDYFTDERTGRYSYNAPISMLDSISQYYTGWTFLSEEQKENLKNRGVLTSNDLQRYFNKTAEELFNTGAAVTDTIEGPGMVVPYDVSIWRPPASSDDSSWIERYEGNTLSCCPPIYSEKQEAVWRKVDRQEPLEGYENYREYYDGPQKVFDTGIEIEISEEIQISSSNTISIRRQRTNNTNLYDALIITNLHVTNYCLNAYPIDYDAVDYINFKDSDENGTCPFIIPFNSVAFKRLSILDRNESLQLMGNILFNCWETKTIKIKFYARAGFQIFITVLTIVIISVVTVISWGGLTAPAAAASGAFSLTASATLNVILTMLIKMVVAVIVKLVVTKIVVMLTGSALLGNVLGIAASIYAVGVMNTGTFSLSANWEFFVSSTTDMAKACIDAITSIGNDLLAIQGQKLQNEAYSLAQEQEEFKKQYDEALDINESLANEFNISLGSDTYNKQLALKIYKQMSDPNKFPELMYLSADFTAQVELQQDYVYSMYDLHIYLPEVDVYV